MARLEKMGDFRQASLAAHGSRYSGPGIYHGVSAVHLASSSLSGMSPGAELTICDENGFAG
jgi:hypothetical protein